MCTVAHSYDPRTQELEIGGSGQEFKVTLGNSQLGASLDYTGHNLKQ